MTRSELERRPLLIICLGLILGLTFARHPLNLALLLPIPWFLKALAPRALFALGVAAGAMLSPPSPRSYLTDNQFIDGEWRIASMPRVVPYGQRCDIEREEMRFSLTYSGGATLCPGATILLVGVAHPPAAGTETFFTARALMGRIAVDGEHGRIVADGPWIQRWGCRWRDAFAGFAGKALPEHAAAVVTALCLNADGMLDQDTRDRMQRTGTTHIIAASGLQVVLLAQCLLWLLQWLPIPRWLQILLAATLLGLYCVATGLHAPVVRAGVMWLVANLAYVVRRERDWPSALAFSSIFYLAWKPASVYDMGFQLSVIAVLFLALFSVPLRRETGAWAWLLGRTRRAVHACVIAFVVTAPLIAYHFGYFSIVSIPANLLILFAVTGTVILSMVALPLGWLWGPLGLLLMKICLPLIGYIEGTLAVLGSEEAVVQVPPFNGYWLAPYYALLLALWRPHVRLP